MELQAFTTRALGTARIDWSGRAPRPSFLAVTGATALALVGSLTSDALIVAIGTGLFPTISGYSHFRISDYAALTVVGVLLACSAWPVVTRIASAPRWLFFRLAVVTTLVLWLPDLYLLIRGQPARAVGVLMVMHLAVATVTYNALVRVAPEGALPADGTTDLARPTSSGAAPSPDRSYRRRSRSDDELSEDALSANARLALLLLVLVAIEFVLGMVTLVLAPVGRPTGFLPARGTGLLVAHAILGLPLAVGAVVLLVRTTGGPRIEWLCGRIGAIGVVLAGLGGLFTVSRPARLAGIALMLVGAITGGFGYLLPTFDRLADEPPGSASPQPR